MEARELRIGNVVHATIAGRTNEPLQEYVIQSVTLSKFKGGETFDFDATKFDNTLTMLTNKMVQAEESVLKNILQVMLEREPTIEDFKLLERRFTEGVFDSYDLYYKGERLGLMMYNYPDPISNVGTYSVTYDSRK